MAGLTGGGWMIGALCAGAALLGASSIALPGSPPLHQAPTRDRYAASARAVIATYCAPCHGGAKPSGDAQLARALTEEDVRQAPDVWARAAENLRSGRMPPPGAKAPTAAQRTAAADALEAIITDCRAPDPGRVTLRRLNRFEYDRTVRDLLGVDVPLAADFPSDDVGEGFDNIGDVLSISTLLMEKYLDAAEQLAAKAIVLPQRRTVRFEGDDLKAPSGVSAGAGGERVLFTNAVVTGEAAWDKGGSFRIRVRAYGQQAGPDVVRMAVLLDDKSVTEFEVRAVRAKPMEYEVPVSFGPGRHRVGAAFLNDYYKADAADPADRDRNLVVDFIEILGPQDGIAELPASHTRLVTAVPGDGLSRAEATRRVLAQFASRAFRRPAKRDEVDRLVRVAMLAEKEGESYERGLQLGVQAALVAPQFLFRVELDPPNAGGAIRDLDDYEIASRLSYFLWSSMPDDRLFALAAQGELRKAPVRAAEVARMLKDPRSRALAESFADQWLQLRKLDIVSPDPQRFPTFDPGLKADMRQETLRFFEAVQGEDRSVLDFLDGKFTYVNDRLAKHYGLAGVVGPEFRKVNLDGVRRAGVVTQASVLTVTSNPTRTSPVKRGKWILEQILGTPTPPPPPGVGDLKDAGGPITAATLRELMVKHRADPACASCHSRMDPLGFGLENFDAVGAWRTTEGKSPIDASGVLPDGTKFDGPAQLRAILRKRKDAFVRTLTQKLMVYGLGRGLTFADRCAVDAIEADAAKKGYRFSALIQGIVASDPFLKRRG